MKQTKREVERYSCGSCKFFNVNADRTESFCKRVDHKTVKFAEPYFKCYDCGQFDHLICADFLPADWHVNAVKEWTNFDEYWENYVTQWLPYSNTDTYISFTLNGDTSVRYRVKLLDFVYGNMYSDGWLNAYEKVYYKQSRSSPTGYDLIVEPIDKVEINGIPHVVSKE